MSTWTRLGIDDGSPLPFIDRQDAAVLLRRARAAQGTADEAIDWAFAAMPDRRHARRLKIEALLAERNIEAASTLIAQGLLVHPTDPALTRLRAKSLLLRGDAREAAGEIRRVLGRRPHHVGSLILAAEIARALGDQPGAIHLLERAAGLRDDRDDVKARLAAVSVEAGRLEAAERTLRSMRVPDAVVEARLLRAHGRFLDAVHRLESARDAAIERQGRPEPADDRFEEITCDLIGLLEEMGSTSRLRELLTETDLEHPRALARAGRAWLLLGDFETAATRMSALADHGRCRAEATAIAIVAKAMQGRRALAEQMLARSHRGNETVPPAVTADLWRRALTGSIVHEQCSALRAGADRNSSLLPALLTSAAEVFGARTSLRDPRRADRAGIDDERNRAICLAALGQPRQAAAAFSRAMPDPPPAPPEVSVTSPLRRAA